MGTSVHASLAEELRYNFPSFEYIKVMYGMTELMLMSSSKDAPSLGVPDAGMRVVNYFNAKYS